MKTIHTQIRSLSLLLLTNLFVRLAPRTMEATSFVCATVLPSGWRLQHFLHFSSLAGNKHPRGGWKSHTHSLNLIITASPFPWLGPVCDPGKVGGGGCFPLFLVFPPRDAVCEELCQERGVGVGGRREVTGRKVLTSTAWLPLSGPGSVWDTLLGNVIDPVHILLLGLDWQPQWPEPCPFFLLLRERGMCTRELVSNGEGAERGRES